MALRRLLAVVAVGSCVLLGVTTAPAEAENPNAGCNQDEFDDWGSGANQSGAYNASCDGSASDNGEGGGGATGEPCAGCVGRADNKNPPGQAPDASDDNAGYECDTNSGIAKTNPAHTGCTQTPSSPPPGGFLVIGDTGGSAPPQVLGTTVVPETPAAAPSAPAVVPVVATAPAPAEVRPVALARTGSATRTLTGAAAVLLALGAALLRAGRVRPAHP